MLKVLLADLAGRPPPRAATNPPRRRARRQGLLLSRQPRPAASQADQDRDPQPGDQIAHRKRRGSAGARCPCFDATTYKARNVIERSFHDHKRWRGLATRYDKLATTYRGGALCSAPSQCGYANKEPRPRCSAGS
jgi:transposase